MNLAICLVWVASGLLCAWYSYFREGMFKRTSYWSAWDVLWSVVIVIIAGAVVGPFMVLVLVFEDQLGG